MERLDSMLRQMLFAAVFLLLAGLSIFPVENPDIWSHLMLGKEMLARGRIIDRNILVYPHTSLSWIYTYWLSRVIIYLIYRAWGANGIVICKFILLSSLIAVILRECSRRYNYILLSILAVFAIYVAQARFVLVPQLFSTMLAVFYFCILNNYKDNEAPRPEVSGFFERNTERPLPIRGLKAAVLRPRMYKRLLWLLPFLQIIWVNSHVYFFLGPFLILCFLIEEITAGIKYKRGDFKALFLVFVFSCLACLLNPRGLKEALSPFAMSLYIKESHNFHGIIAELSPLFTGAFSFRRFMMLTYIFVTFSSFFIAKKMDRIRISYLFIYLFLLGFALRFQRNIALFSFTALLISMHNFKGARFLEARPYVTGRARLIACSVAVIPVFFILGQKARASHIYDVRPFGLGVSTHAFPVGACDFIESSGIRGNMFNNYESGGYIALRFYPRRKPFIESIFSIEEKVFKDYLNALLLKESPAELEARYSITYFVLPHYHSDMALLIKRLYDDPLWKAVYLDPAFIVFLKDNAANRGIIKRYSIDMEGYIKRATFEKPADYVRMGDLFYMLGEYGMSEAEYRTALEKTGDLFSIWYRLGSIAYKRRQYARAEAIFARCQRLRPFDDRICYMKGMSLVRQGRYKDAIGNLRFALFLNPGNAAAHYNIAVAYSSVVPARLDIIKKHLKKAESLGYHIDEGFVDYITGLERKERL